MKPVVFSIHGIRSTGKWQDWNTGAAAVLAPFFDYQRLKHTQYRRWAISKMAGPLFLIIACSTLACYDFEKGVITTVTWWIAFSVASIALIATCHVFLSRRLQRTVERMYDKMRATAGGRGKPSIIAHSLGTLITAEVMERFPSWTFSLVILTGCVVKRRFTWDASDQRIEYVFNEIAALDPVPYFAGLLRPTIANIGTAGARGFKGTDVAPGIFRPTQTGPVLFPPALCCEPHIVHYSDHKIYNIRYKRISHNGYQKGRSHAWDFWLPRLLRVDPALYKQLHMDCAAVLQSEGKLANAYRDEIARVRNTCYGWTGGSLESCIKLEIERIAAGTFDQDKIEEIVTAAVLLLAEDTSETVNTLENAKTLPDQDDPIWRSLDPRLATQKAVQAAVEEARTLPR